MTTPRPDTNHSWSFTFDALPTITLIAHEADITVHHDAPEGTATMHLFADDDAHVEGIAATSEADSATLTVPPLLTSGKGRGFAFQLGRTSISIGHTARVQLEAHVPAGAHLDVDTRSGDVTVNGHTGRATVRSSSGDVRLDRVDRAAVESGSGDAWVGSLGSGRLRTGSGDVELQAVLGEVDVTTGSGEVTVAELDGRLTSRTGSGDLVVQRMRAGELDARAGSGDISVGVVAGCPVWQEVSTSTGDVAVDLTPRGAPAEGQQHATVRATTTTGDVRLHDA